jgi:GTP cyclohydrolase I
VAQPGGDPDRLIDRQLELIDDLERKLARLVEHFAAAPQMQERLTQQIARWLNKSLKPRGVGVVLQAEHMCMPLRGVQAPGTRMLPSELLGPLRDDPAAWAEFFDLSGVART